MKKIFLILTTFCTVSLYAEETPVESKEEPKPVAEAKVENPNKYNAITIGILQGGGALIGVDYERILFNNLSVQVGGGYIGFGGSILYHFQPTVHSSAVGITFWNQGLPGAATSQQALGATFVFRLFDWITGQIGIGYVLFRGDTMTQSLRSMFNVEPPPVMLLYSIGGYFAF